MAKPTGTARSGSLIILRLLAAAGLAYDAYVHLHLASNYEPIKESGTLSQGALFRLEAILAILAVVLILVLPRLLSYGYAFLVAIGGFAAVVLYRYVNVGRLGPLPNMYEPSWSITEKLPSAIAEAVAALLLLMLLALSRRVITRQPSRSAVRS